MRTALIGYGEVGKILAEDLRARGLPVVAFDAKLHADAGEPMREHALLHGVVLAGSHATAVMGADLVISAVTPSQAVAVARDCVRGLTPGAFFLDLNSASPGAKQQAAELVVGVGARYIEGAVMTSVPPYRKRRRSSRCSTAWGLPPSWPARRSASPRPPRCAAA
jgi:3-hydroxyisobutyrate dehydrogenase-like beta-hydroxyacid dehydrogenase